MTKEEIAFFGKCEVIVIEGKVYTEVFYNGETLTFNTPTTPMSIMCRLWNKAYGFGKEEGVRDFKNQLKELLEIK